MGMASTVASKLVCEPTTTPFEVSLLIPGYQQTNGDIGLVFMPGELQGRAMQLASMLFSHAYFVRHTVKNHGHEPLMVYQIQKPDNAAVRIFGTLVTTIERKFVAYCVETDAPRLIGKNKQVMAAAKLRLCKS